MDIELIKKYKRLDFKDFNNDMDRFVNSNDINSETNYLIVTNLKTKHTYIYRKMNSKWIRLYKWPSTIGKPSTPTRRGMFRITEKVHNWGWFRKRRSF